MSRRETAIRRKPLHQPRHRFPIRTILQFVKRPQSARHPRIPHWMTISETERPKHQKIHRPRPQSPNRQQLPLHPRRRPLPHLLQSQPSASHQPRHRNRVIRLLTRKLKPQKLRRLQRRHRFQRRSPISAYCAASRALPASSCLFTINDISAAPYLILIGIRWSATRGPAKVRFELLGQSKYACTGSFWPAAAN